MEPQNARVRLRTLINTQYPLNRWLVPQRDAATQSIHRYQIAEPGIHSFQTAAAPAFEALSRRPPGPLKDLLRAELDLALEKSHLAEASLVPRLHRACAADDRHTIALCTAILGEGHPEIAYLRNPESTPAPRAPQTPDPLAGPLEKFALMQAVLLEQDVGTLHAVASAHYQYEAVQDHRPVTPEKVAGRLNGHHAPLNIAIEDATLAREATLSIADPAQRVEVEEALDTMIITLSNARTYWRSVLEQARPIQSHAPQDMACAWLGGRDPAVTTYRLTTHAADITAQKVLHYGEQQCVSIPEEQTEAWEQVTALPDDAYGDAIHTPPHSPPAPSVQDPSVARLLEERRRRAAPFRAFAESMMGPDPSSR